MLNFIEQATNIDFSGGSLSLLTHSQKIRPVQLLKQLSVDLTSTSPSEEIKNIAILSYLPWCKKSQAMFPVWESVAYHFNKTSENEKNTRKIQFLHVNMQQELDAASSLAQL